MTSEVHTWSLALEGHDFDLEDFPLWLAGQPVSVHKDEGRTYHLRIPASMVGSDLDTVRTAINEYVEVLNGVARILYPDHHPVRTSRNLVGLGPDGAKVMTAVLVTGAESRGKVGTIRLMFGSELQPDPREAAATPFLRAAEIDGHALNALRLLGREDISWRDLYVIFEFVEGSAGSGMYEKGWISKNKATRFSRTADSFKAIGFEARHAVKPVEPPDAPMPLAEARNLIVALVEAWLRECGRVS